MLANRAIGRLCNVLFADTFSGSSLVMEEFEDEIDVEPDPDEPTPDEPEPEPDPNQLEITA